MPRIPIESARPLAWFAALRVAMVATALVALALFDIPDREELIFLTAAVAAPLSLAILYIAQRNPALALHPAVALADLAILAGAEAIAPDSYAAVRFLALFLIAAHAHFQGAQRGVAIAAAGAAMLVITGMLVGTPVEGAVLAFYETLFVAAALAAGFFVGSLRTAESAGRLRARELSRRALDAETQIRRSLAAAIHDGPVQELVSLDMILDASRRSLERGDSARAGELLTEAQAIAERNIGTLREEIVSLGPYAIDEVTLDAALEQCAPVWAKRYGIEIDLDLEQLDLANDLCGSLFGIAQEAVVNAGRHAEARRVDVSLARHDGHVELRVADDGHGFAPERPFAPDEPGHIGLATMRERAELVDGALRIDTSADGTVVLARVPYVPASASPREAWGAAAAMGASRTAIPFRNVIPASGSRSSGSALVSRL
jgi:signal transduction histidine kinase